MKSIAASKPNDPVSLARKTLLEGVGAEIAASFPGITRLGGQVVAALYLSDVPRSMDDLSDELGRSKSNIFANLRGLEAAGIVQRHRASGARHDTFSLRGKYPDVIIGAYFSRLRRVVSDKQQLCARTLEILGNAKGAEADAIRDRMHTLARKYDRFALIFGELLPNPEGPFDLESLIDALPTGVLTAIAAVARRALGFGAKESKETSPTKSATKKR
jgi:HTH-type transcriptional regulator, osmoprotectant uptake regulator